VAEEVGVAFVRLVPSMRGFGPEAQRALNDGLQGPARAAGQQAGRDAGEGAGSRFGAAFKGAMLGAGVLAGAALIGGVTEALDQGRLSSKLAAQLDLTKEESARVGKVAGDLYADAYGDSFETVNTAAGAVMSSIKGMSDASAGDLKSATAEALNFSETFDIDIPRAVQTAGTAINSGLAKDSTEAFDLITAASNRVPAALREDVLDASDEYGQFFNTLGFDGPQAFGVLVDASKKGEIGIDKAGDAVKEFTVLSTDMSTSSQEAYKTIRLDAREMANAILAGGDTAQDATQKIIDGLLGIKDPSEQANTAIALFGTPLEDMNVKDIPEFLEGLKGTSGAMDGFEGATNRAGDALRDNAATEMTRFKRGLQQNLVDFLGGEVIPALNDFRGVVGKTFGGIWSEAGKGSDGTVDRIINVFAILGQRLGQKIAELAPKAVEGLLGLGGKIADFVTANPEKVFKIGLIAAGLIMAIVALPLLVAAAISASAALIMIGFVKKLLSTLGENLPKWWASFTGWISAKAGEVGDFFGLVGAAIGVWFSGLWSKYISGPVSRQWTSFITTVRGLPGRATGALGALGGRLSAASSAAWQRFRDAAGAKVTSFITWVTGIPGRISKGVGNLKDLLYNKGLDVVSGLWNGIRDQGAWLKSTLSGWVKDIIPGPIAKALNIGSPSKLMAKAVGRWIPAGIAEGWEANMGAITAMGPATATAATAALPAGAAGTGAVAPAGTTVVIDGTNMPRALEEWLQHNTRIIGGGSVDRWLNQSAG
jgi:hypothetical protein